MAILNTTTLAELGRYSTLAAEYYQPEFVAAATRIKAVSRKVTTLKRCTQPQFPITYGVLKPREVKSGRYRLARIQNSEGLFMFGGDLPPISSDQFSEYARSEVREGDIVLAIGGYIGPLGIISQSDDCRLNINRHLARISPEPTVIDRYYLAAFLASSVSQSLLVREIRGAVQAGINIADLKLHPVFLPSAGDQERVGTVMKAAENELVASRFAYSQAVRHLESELGMDELAKQPTGFASRFCTIGLGKAFDAGRIDAQCFAPAALYLDDHLRSLKGLVPLSHLLLGTAKGRQHDDAANGPIEYCSIKHVTGRELVGVSRCFPSKGTAFADRNDLLLAVTGATIGKIGIVKRYSRLAFSGDLLRLRCKVGVDPHYLLAVLSHKVGQVQFNRWITGSTNGHLAPRDVRRILVPRLLPKTEKKIAELVEESLLKKAESERLLEKAKARVEQLIEEAVKS